MKKISLLSLITALFVATTGATAHETDAAINLPVLAVTASRSTPAEDHVNRSLNALRALANRPVAISVELPALKATLSASTMRAAATRVAKL